MKYSKLLKEHFKDWEEVNHRNSKTKWLFKFRIYKLTGDMKEFSLGSCYVYYKLNKLNPLVWLGLILGIIPAMFVGGIIPFLQNSVSEMTRREKLEIRHSIVEKYKDDFEMIEL